MELAKIFLTVAVDGAEKAGAALGQLGNAAVKVGKVAAAGLAAASAAVGALTKTSIENYAEYEQLVGGVETLFKDSSNQLMKYAQDAYKTSGMSANEYMTTATSFAASLIQSLGSDTEKAVEIVDMAVVDMADNANKMGTDITLIQNAYQGFAKQNYTMLDNLKLGYGGTKTEMERLLKDAQKLTGIKYDIKNLDDVYAAIHAVQVELGISGISAEEAAALVASGAMTAEEAFELMGTTAKEASTTIQGSWSMTKAAWSNLVTGLADDTQDFDALMTYFVGSATTLLGNLLPRIQTIFNSIPDLIRGIAPQLPGIIQSFLPGLLEGALALIVGLAEQLPEIASVLFDAIKDLMNSVMETLFERFPGLEEKLHSAYEFISGIFSPAIETFKETWNKLKEALQPVIDKVKEYITSGQAANDGTVLLQTVLTFLAGVFQTVCLYIQAAIDIIVWLIETIKKAVEACVEFVTSIPEKFEEFKDNIETTITTLVSNALAKWESLKAGFAEKVENIKTNVQEKFQNVKDTIEEKITGAKDKVTEIFTNIKDTIEEKINNAKDKVEEAIDKIKSLFDIELGFTKIKIPKFSISGFFDGDKGTVPSIGVTWEYFAKGGVLQKPTIFGMNGMNPMVGGEAGAEAVAPIDVLQGYVADAVASQNAGLIAILERILNAILAMDENMGGNLREALDGTALTINKREFGRLVRTVM